MKFLMVFSRVELNFFLFIVPVKNVPTKLEPDIERTQRKIVSELIFKFKNFLLHRKKY